MLLAVAILAAIPAVRAWLAESSWWRQYGRLLALAIAFGCFGIASWRRPLPMVAVGAAVLLVATWATPLSAAAGILAVAAVAAVVYWARHACHEALPSKLRDRRARLAHVRAEIRKARVGLKRLAERAHRLDPAVVEKEVQAHLEERKTAQVFARLRREPVPWPAPEGDGPDADRLRFLISHFPESLGLAHGLFLEAQAHPAALPAYGSRPVAPGPIEPHAKSSAGPGGWLVRGLRDAFGVADPDHAPEHGAGVRETVLSEADLADRAASLRLLEPLVPTWERRIAEIRQEVEARFDADHAIEQSLRGQWSAGRDVIAAARAKEEGHTRELKLEEAELVSALGREPEPAPWALAVRWLLARRRLDPKLRPGARLPAPGQAG